MIFLDMDGVLSDFHKASIRQITGSVDKYEEIKDQWDIAKALGISQTQFWQALDTFEFWYGMPMMPFCGELLYAFPNASILSSPARGYSASGKYEWCRKYAKGRKVILTSAKHLLAAKGRVLIDDLESNIQEWEAYGGTGILYPAPYNSARDQSHEAFIELTRRKLSEA